MAVTAVVIAGLSTAGNVVQTRKANKQRRRAAEVQRKRNALESRRARVKSIEEFRIASGLVENVGAQSGAAGSSGFAALQASLSSQLSTNLNFNQQLQNFAEQQGSFLSKANSAAGLANDFGAIASFASSFATAQSKKTKR